MHGFWWQRSGATDGLGEGENGLLLATAQVRGGCYRQGCKRVSGNWTSMVALRGGFCQCTLTGQAPALTLRR